ncbi:MAG: DUF4091 domain-containing protein [Verrucomicrobia subdivision 3 bacterium]|nr:DUF4091 domain-containing protein [Limisphaerales bacterium]
MIRCSYPWEAPGAGAYEFLGRLTAGGKDYMLGKDTASPHGGIDTQFVVGSPAEGVSFEPWSDAPFALNRGKRTLKRALAAQGPTAVWFESALEKIFPDDEVQAAGTVQPTARLMVARNESESVQIVVRPASDRQLFDVNVNVGALTNDSTGDLIAESNVRVSTVAYYPVRIPSHFEGPTGLWPDALPPFEPFAVKGGQCQPLWITVHIPSGTPAGEYVAPIAITSAQSDPIELFMRVEVLDFDLPVTPSLKTDFGFDSGNAAGWCKALGYTGTPQALDDAYLNLGLAHRVTLRELVQLPAESPDYAGALKAYAPKLASALKAGASSVSVPPSLLELPEQLAQANAFVAKQGLKGKAFCQIADEPLRPAWPRLVERMTQWKAAAPDIPLVVTTFGTSPLLHEICNIWAVHVPVFDTVNSTVLLGEIAKGRETWWYVNQTPPRPYANFFIDFAAMEHRILFWQSWVLGIKGMHYWAANYTEQGENPWFDQLDVTPCNGDGCLIYPSPKGPVSSIRLATIRDGIEDYDYLVLFANLLEAVKKKGGNAALVAKAEKENDFKTLVPDLVSFTRDPNVLLGKREALGHLIAEMSRAAK